MNNDLKKRLIEVRKSYNLSGYAFAKKLNIPQPTYLRYETGEQKPSARLIEALVLICNVNAHWLFTGEGNMFYDPFATTGDRYFSTRVRSNLSGFGKRLSLLQAQHNFLDKEMAKILGVTEKQYIAIVTGAKLPDLELLTNLKQNFKVSVDSLLFDI